MSFRQTVQAFFLLTAVAAAHLTGPQSANAQEVNKGQIVSAIAKLNQAQMAFAKKLADDQSFADQFDAATSSGNWDAAATLVAGATGVSKSNITVSGRRPLPGSASNDVPQQRGMIHLASFRSEPAPVAVKGAVLCFNIGIASGCVYW
jgi:hypothetical protein